MSVNELLLDLKVDEITFHLNQLRGLGFVLGVDTQKEGNRFIVVDTTTAGPTHYITYDEEEGTLNWKRSNE